MIYVNVEAIMSVFPHFFLLDYHDLAWLSFRLSIPKFSHDWKHDSLLTSDVIALMS